MSPDDARKEPRVKTTDVVVRYSAATVEEFIEKHAHDVSRSGMCVRTPTPLAAGALVTFEIRTANDAAVIAGVGRVVWKRDNPQGERPAGMGVKFIDLDDASQAVIERLIEANDGPGSEFEKGLVPGDAGKGAGTRTVMGMGSPILVPPAAAAPADAGPAVPTTPSPKPQAGPPVARTQLGLAPPILPAKLVLDEHSSGGLVPAARAPSTSDIDEDWLADKVDAALPRAADPAPAVRGAAVETAPKTVVAARREATRPSAEPAKEPVTETSAARPLRASAQAIVETIPGEKRGRLWPWALLLLALAAAGAAYYYRGQLNRAGLHNALIDMGIASEPPIPAPVPVPIPAPTPPPAPTPAPSPSTAVAPVLPTATVSAGSGRNSPPTHPSGSAKWKTNPKVKDGETPP